MANKTKREYFAEIRELVIDNAELVAFVDHEVAQLDKKKNAERKPTATQLENIGFKNDILVALADADKPVNIKELVALVPALDGLTNQRIARLLTDLRKAKKGARTVVGKTPHYALGAEEDVEA